MLGENVCPLGGEIPNAHSPRPQFLFHKHSQFLETQLKQSEYFRIRILGFFVIEAGGVSFDQLNIAVVNSY